MTQNPDDPKIDVEETDGEPPAPPEAPQLTGTDELEAALREAVESKDARDAAKGSEAGHVGGLSSDKMTIELLSNELQELKGVYEACQVELTEEKDRLLRLQAEFENFRRRGLKERQENLQYGSQNLVKDLLTTVDNLERAIEHTEQNEDANLNTLLQGVELVRGELLGALAKHGVIVVEAAGQPFDPTIHEALGQVPSEEFEPNTVVSVLQKGYLLRDRLLRAARVMVSVGGSKPADE